MSAFWNEVSIIADALDKRLEPPPELERRDCLACNATGHQIDPETRGSLIECEPCDGTGRVDVDPDDDYEEYEPD